MMRSLYAAPDIIRVMEWSGHVARIGEMRNAYKFWSERMKGRNHSEGLNVDWRVILD